MSSSQRDESGQALIEPTDGDQAPIEPKEPKEPTEATEDTDLLRVCIADDVKDVKFVQHAVGPLIPWMRVLALLGLAFQCGFLGLTLTASKCKQSERGTTVTYPYRIWLLVPVCLLVRWLAELRALRYYLPPYCKTVNEAGGKAFSLMGRQCSIKLWLCFYLSLSTLSFVDQAMDSASTATTTQLFACRQGDLQYYWSQTWHQSLMSFMPVPRLGMLVWVAWFLTLPQIILPVLLTWGRGACCLQINHAVGDAGADVAWGCCNIWHVDVFEGLSEACGMATFQHLSFVRSTSRIDKHIKDSHDRTGFKVVECALALTKTFTLRVLLTYVFENSLQANLQSTLWALNSVSLDVTTQMQMQNFLSIMVTIFTSLMKLSEYMAFEKVINRVRDTAKDDEKEETKDLLWRVLFYRWLVRLFTIILCLNLLYAAGKVFMSGFVCDHQTWNLNGCTSLHPRPKA